MNAKTHTIENTLLHLSPPFEYEAKWIGAELPAKQLRAAWLKIDENDLPMNPRLVGKPGVGKTTLAIAVAKTMGLPVFVLQATSDMRPEDLLITPVIAEGKNILYVASPLVTAMITGGILVLDEGNRMSEKSWASLVALLDHRRYVDSIIAGIRIHAHPEFRFVTTMNDDASVYDLPEYIQSRLNPQIFVDFADADTEKRIIKYAIPYADEDLLTLLIGFLARSHEVGESHSVRDGIQIAKYATRLKNMEPHLSIPQALVHAMQAVLGQEAANRFLSETFPRSPLRSL